MAEESREASRSRAAGAWRTYLELASGLGEVSRKQVRKVLKDLVGKGNATAEQIRSMTAELVAANAANREALGRLVKVEVDRALGRVGLATMDEVNELTTRVRELERQLREARTEGAAPARTVAPTPARSRKEATGDIEPAAPRGGRPTKKATKSAAVARATATKTTAKKAVRAKAAPAKATPAKAAPAKATKARSQQ